MPKNYGVYFNSLLLRLPLRKNNAENKYHNKQKRTRTHTNTNTHHTQTLFARPDDRELLKIVEIRTAEIFCRQRPESVTCRREETVPRITVQYCRLLTSWRCHASFLSCFMVGVYISYRVYILRIPLYICSSIYEAL